MQPAEFLEKVGEATLNPPLVSNAHLTGIKVWPFVGGRIKLLIAKTDKSDSGIVILQRENYGGEVPICMWNKGGPPSWSRDRSRILNEETVDWVAHLIDDELNESASIQHSLPSRSPQVVQLHNVAAAQTGVKVT